jgi:lipid-A-disaccharide synthase-like uncharacterized protein
MIAPLFTLHLLGKAMPFSWLTLFGLTSNVLFSGRVLIQWIASERRGKSVVPVAFWWVSLVASIIQMTYAIYHRDAHGAPDPDLPMFLGLSVTLVPYLRNLRIYYRPDRPSRGGAQILAPAVALLIVLIYGVATGLPRQNWWLFGMGLVGQAIYASRFIVAWVRAEAIRKADLPLAFWWLSLIGSLILLAYSVLRVDPVFILSYLFNSIPYVRNIMLLKRAAPDAH